MTSELNASLIAIKEAIRAGDKRRAKELLQRAAQANPDDIRIWLWLTTLATSRQEGLDYVSQAERLAPGDDRVKKARTWTMQHFPEQPPKRTAYAASPMASARKSPSKTPQKPPREELQPIKEETEPVPGEPEPVEPVPAPKERSPADRWFRITALLLLISFLVVSLGLAYIFINRDTLLVRDQPQGSLLKTSDQLVVASLNQNYFGSPSATPLPSPTFSSTAVPTETDLPVIVEKSPSINQAPQRANLIQPKNVVSKSEPLPMWTSTPKPTETPTPSPTPFPTFVSDPAESPPARPHGLALGEKWIDVNLASQELVAYEGNTPVFDSLVSTGTNSHPTVTGQFRIWLRLRAQDMDGRRLGYDYFLRNVPYVQYFYDDYALHGTFWHNNFGRQMSHGCVNLPTPAAEWLFNWAEYGTLVNVHY